MLSSAAIAFLKRLLDAPGPSGFETLAGRSWRSEAQTFAEKVTTDIAGNCIAEVNAGGSPTILIDGHIDEIGVIVQYVDDDGFLYISPIGGWDAQVLVGQRIRFIAATGDVIGVVGRKPVHVMKNGDRDQAVKFADLWVDIGSKNRAESEARISVGDPGVIDSRAHDFPGNRIVSRSIDDRIGAFAALEALRRYAESPGAARVVAAATTQEEIAWHGGGALVATNEFVPRWRSSSTSRTRPIIRVWKKRRSAIIVSVVVRSSVAARCSPLSSSSCCAAPLGRKAFPSACTPSVATRRPMPTPSTSRRRASRRGSSRSPTATCTRRTRW